jgi:hypothetical protein
LFGGACPDDYFQVPFHWRRMMQDPQFQGEIGNEYFRLRKGLWKTDKLNAYIDSVANTIDEAQARNFQRWPVLGQYLWPNPKPIPTTWRGEGLELKTWLTSRLSWLDANMPAPTNTGLVLGVDTKTFDDVMKGFAVNILGNPTGDNLLLSIDSERVMEVDIEIIDTYGRSQRPLPITLLQQGKNNLAVPLGGASGGYVLKINTPTGVVRKKILKK